MVPHCVTGPGSFLDLAFQALARLAFSARIGRALSHRARSASKKDGLAAAFPFSRDRLPLSFGMAPVLVPLRP